MPQFSNFSHPHRARFPFILSAPILVSSPITFSFIFSLHLTSLTSSCHPCYPLVLSSLFLSSRSSSLICSVSLLSCFQPSPLILPVSSYPTFRSSFHPFPRLSVYLFYCLSQSVLPKECANCHFQKPRSSPFLQLNNIDFCFRI